MSQEATDCLPEAQSKSGVTQLDDTVTVASTNDQEENEPIGHTSVTVPEILTASDCQERVQSSPEARVSERMMPQATDEDVSFMILEAAASAELPLNVVEALIREENSRTSHDAVTILDQEIPEEFSFHSLDPVSTIDIQGSAAARSDQGIAQVTSSLPSSSASLVNHSEVVQENGVQPPNISNGGSTLNAPALTSLPNNLLRHLFSNPYDYEIEKLRIEEENGNKNFEETTSELMAELERKMAELWSEYDRGAQELDAKYNAREMEIEANKSSVEMSSLLANAYKSKCADVSTSDSNDLEALRAIFSQYSALQQQQAVQTSSTSSVTAAEAPIPFPSGLLSLFPRCTTTQPRPISQEVIEIDTDVDSTSPPRPSVTATEAPTPNLSAPLSHLPSCTTTQPRPISQEVIEIDADVDSTAPPRPSVTATEAPTSNPQGPLSHFPRSTTTQPRPISQEVIEIDTDVDSTDPPRPSVTATEAPTSNLQGPLPHFPPRTTTQSTPISQQTVQTNTNMSSTAPLRPSVTAAEPPTPNPPGPHSHFPPCTTAQPTQMSQQAAVQANTHMSSTAPPQPSVTAAEAPLSQPTLISQQAPVQANTHTSSTASPPRPSVTAAEPPTPNPPGPLSHFPRCTTAQSTPISQKIPVQANKHLSSTGLPRPPSVTSKALSLHSPRSNTPPQPRPPPVISNLTPSSSTAASSPPVHGTVRGPAPHIKPFPSSRDSISAGASTKRPRLVQEQQQQQQGNSNVGLVYLSDDE